MLYTSDLLISWHIKNITILHAKAIKKSLLANNPLIPLNLFCHFSFTPDFACT